MVHAHPDPLLGSGVRGPQWGVDGGVGGAVVRGGAARSKAARTCNGLWWFFAALVVVTPGDFTDVDDQGNPLVDLMEWLVPVLGGQADSDSAIAAFFSFVAVVWLAVTVWVVMQQSSRVPGPGSNPGAGPGPNPGPAPGPGSPPPVV